MLFQGSTNFFLSLLYFYFCLAFKTIDTHMSFWSVLKKKSHRNTNYLPKTAKMAFLTVNNLSLVGFQKYWPKEYLCVYCFKAKWITAETQRQIIIFFLILKTRFLGVQISSFLNSNLEFVCLRLFCNVKGSFMPIFCSDRSK